MSTIKWFDLDHTLFDHDESVIDMNDWSSFDKFRSSHIFSVSAIPIPNVIAELQKSIEEGHKTEILTARADFDCKYKFLRFLNESGINTDKVHVRRAGNMSEHLTTPEKKFYMAHALIQENNYKEAWLYDDNIWNLVHFSTLPIKTVCMQVIKLEDGKFAPVKTEFSEKMIQQIQEEKWAEMR